MSAQTVIDSLEFARAEGELRGCVAIGSLTRLRDSLFDTDGTISYRLKGGHDKESHPILTLEVGGTLRLRCQRCLGSMLFELNSSNTLRLMHRGERAESVLIDPMSPDSIEASEALDVVALVEDETLLSLPMAPRHEEPSCMVRVSEPEGAGDRLKPFAELAKLKKIVDNGN